MTHLQRASLRTTGGHRRPAAPGRAQWSGGPRQQAYPRGCPCPCRAPLNGTQQSYLSAPALDATALAPAPAPKAGNPTVPAPGAAARCRPPATAATAARPTHIGPAPAAPPTPTAPHPLGAGLSPSTLTPLTTAASAAASTSSAPATLPAPTPTPDPTRRSLLLLAAAAAAGGLLSAAGLAAPGGGGAPLLLAPASARLLHSRRSEVPCELTVRNVGPRPVEALWVNYDGDEEPYTTIPPGQQWTVGTFESHPWRFRDARSGSLVREYVAEGGQRVLQLYDEGAGMYGDDGGGGGTAPYGAPGQRGGSAGAAKADGSSSSAAGAVGSDEPDAGAPGPSAPERPGRAGGFDGLGNSAQQYTLGRLLSVAVLPQQQQAVVVLGMERFARPLSLLVGVAEARGIVNAAGAAAAPGAGGGGSRGRRPGLLATWENSLQALGGSVERVVITRQVGGIFYARIVIRQQQQEQQQPGQPAAAAAAAAADGAAGPGRGAGGGGGGGGEAAGAGGVVVVSVDSRPSDALALALQAGVDVFVSLPVAEMVQRQYEEAERELPEMLLTPPEAGDLLGAPSA